MVLHFQWKKYAKKSDCFLRIYSEDDNAKYFVMILVVVKGVMNVTHNLRARRTDDVSGYRCKKFVSTL